MTKRIVTAMLLLLAAGTTYADFIDINLHDDAIRITYGWPIEREAQGGEGELGVLYNDNTDLMVHAGFVVSGENWSERGTFQIGLGGRLILLDVDSDRVGAFAVGGKVRFSPVARAGLSVDAWYAPNITTFMDGERMREYSVRADYQLLPHAFIYIGYRDVEVRFDDSFNYDFDSDVHIGMQLFF